MFNKGEKYSLTYSLKRKKLETLKTIISFSQGRMNMVGKITSQRCFENENVANEKA